MVPIPSAGPLERTRLHIVTGKGGVGKTTVAAALAVALAHRDQRVLLAEVEERQGISQTFDIPPLSSQETRVLTTRSGGELWGLSVDAKAALLEYLQMFYRLGRAGSALEKVGAIDFATTIAPGVRDVLLIGKIYEAARRGAGRRKSGSHGYDAVVLDAPPTGRVARFLNVNSQVADLARVGPIKSQAESITTMLQSPTTAVHVVTLLEEMPVQECAEAVAELGSISLRVGSIVVNQIRRPLLSPEVISVLRSARPDLVSTTQRDLADLGVSASPEQTHALLAEAEDYAQRLELQSAQEDIVAGLGVPLLRLNHLPYGLGAGGVESDGITVLADDLARQGWQS